MASIIQVRVEDVLKTNSDELFKELGTDTTMINPYVALTENEILVKLERFRKHAATGMYREAKDVVWDISLYN